MLVIEAERVVPLRRSFDGLRGRATGMTRRCRVSALLALAAIGLVSSTCGEPSASAASSRAYYLFLASPPEGCEDCYIPLVILRETLEQLAASARSTTIVLVTTYERDSIWKVERGVSLAGADVSIADRIVRLRGRRYRYQEVALCHRAPGAAASESGRLCHGDGAPGKGHPRRRGLVLAILLPPGDAH